jgi:hypothetical protein
MTDRSYSTVDFVTGRLVRAGHTAWQNGGADAYSVQQGTGMRSDVHGK